MGGRLAPVGLLTGRPTTGATAGSAGVDITPIRVGSRQDFEAMNRAIEYHGLHPQIDSSYKFVQLREALRHLESGRQFGKIVIMFD